MATCDMWTFAAANDEVATTNSTVPVSTQPFQESSPALLMRTSYYYETGSRNEAERRYYFDDPLWDGEGCEGENECCDRGGPWFCKQLPQPTQDDIEMRVCTNNRYETEDAVLEQIVLYIQ